MKKVIVNDIKVSNQCERLLYALVLILVFEGILRKLLTPLSTPIFFLKDLICIICIIQVSKAKLTQIISKLNTIWVRLFFLFLPLLVITAGKDPILALFAAKQYLLYFITGIAVIVSFTGTKEEKFRNFIFFMALLLIPTTLVAVLENSLPASHWLNKGVNGDSLEGFSAAGYLRVGSTFSFTAQYSWFLNAESFFLATSFFMPPQKIYGLAKKYQPALYSVLALMLIIGAFITGGRTAVVGCAGTMTIGLILIGVRRPSWLFSKGVAIVCIGIVSLTVLKAVKPQYFAAYDKRASGTEQTSNSEEVTNRVIGGLTDWTIWFEKQDAAAMIIGNGLGVMSNGADKVSLFAFTIRNSGFWTEGDMPTTIWEGGLYLGIIWYGFRLFIILLCYRIWRSIKDIVLVSAVSVPFAYVIIHGVIAQLGMQPPLSIWWWFAIGIIFTIYQFEKYKTSTTVKEVKYQKHEKKNYIY